MSAREPSAATGLRESPTAEVRHYTDGTVEVIVRTAYGEDIVNVSVSPRKGWNDRFADHEVSFSQRDEKHLGDETTCMIGSTFRVSVPLSTGEQEEARRAARR